MRLPTFRHIFFLVLILGFFAGVSYGLYETWMYFRIESLVYDLRSRYNDVVEKSVNELKSVDAKRVVPALIRSLPQENQPVNPLSAGYEKVYDLLTELTGASCAEDADLWRQWETSPEGRRFLGKQVE